MHGPLGADGGLQQGWVVPRTEGKGKSDCGAPHGSHQPLPPAHSLPACCPGRWTFGDGEQVIGQFKPPYNDSFRVPDPTVAQVLVEHNTTHTYAVPGRRRARRPAVPPATSLGRPCPGDSPSLGDSPPRSSLH